MTKGTAIPESCCPHIRSPCTRREAVVGAAWLGASLVLTACGAERSVAPAAEPDAYSVSGNTIVVRLDKASALGRPDSALVIGELNVVVLRVGDADYRAFSNVCTHAGCGISLFIGGRLRCQCHGSEFDTDGANVVGPAVQPLPRYATTVNRATQELRITRGT